MSEPGPADPLFPDWTRDATAASLRERREVLEGRLGRLAESLRDSTSPRFGEIHSLRADLQALPEGRAWRERTQALTVAQQQRQAHVASTRRGRRFALALAAGVLAISLVGWAGKRPRPLQEGIRTRVNGQRIHTAGESVAVAGRGVVTLIEGGQPSLRLHRGRVEVSSRGAERVVLAVGSRTVHLDGGRMEVERQGGTVQVRAAEGQVTVLDSDGGGQVLEPGDPPWTGLPPEEAETCSGVAEPSRTTAVSDARPDGLPAPDLHVLQVHAGGLGPTETSGGEAAEGHSATAVLVASGAEERAASPALPRPPPTLSMDADYRPWTPPNLVRTSGGTRQGGTGASAVQPLAQPSTDPGVAPSTAQLVASAGGRVSLPVLGVDHDVVHTMEGDAVVMAIDPASGFGFCPLPPPLPDPVPVPVAPAPSPSADGDPSPVRASAGSLASTSPTTARTPPTREIPPVPAARAVETGPEAVSSAADPQHAREALLGVVFGTGIEGAECAP